jgi:hypothetical protein
VEKITYSDAAPGVDRANRRYRFDAAEVLGDLRHPMFNYRWAIGERTTNGLNVQTGHAYRPRLPTDAELAAIRDDTTLTNVLGNFRIFPWELAVARIGSESRHFTLGTNNTLETLSVYFYKNTPGTNIQSVTIRRGIFRREGVWWYP